MLHVIIDMKFSFAIIFKTLYYDNMIYETMNYNRRARLRDGKFYDALFLINMK